jgi:hypothetical protein
MTKRPKRSRRPPKPEGMAPNIRHRGKVDSNAPQRLASLQDVTRQLPDAEELERYVDQIKSMGDREAVLALAALLDTCLETCGSWCFVALSKDAFEEIFRDRGAPLSSFSARIILAEALGVVPSRIRVQLDSIRRIRNVFAHTVRSLDFTNPSLAAEAMKLDVKKMIRDGVTYLPDREDARGRFEEAALFIVRHLLYFIGSRLTGIKDGSWPLLTPYESKFT